MGASSTSDDPHPQVQRSCSAQKVCAPQAQGLPPPRPGGSRRVCRRPPPPAPPASWCPLKVTADKAPASAERGDPGPALVRAQTLARWGVPRASAQEREASREGGRDRGSREEAQSPGPAAPASPALAPGARCCRLRCRCRCRRHWCAPGPARPGCGCGSSAAAAPRSPRPAAPPPPACLLPSAASATAALRSARLPPSSLLPAPSAPARSPQALPKLCTDSAPLDPERTIPSHPRPLQARVGASGEGSPASPWGAISRYLHQHQPLTHPTPIRSLALEGTPPHSSPWVTVPQGSLAH